MLKWVLDPRKRCEVRLSSGALHRVVQRRQSLDPWLPEVRWHRYKRHGVPMHCFEQRFSGTTSRARTPTSYCGLSRYFRNCCYQAIALIENWVPTNPEAIPGQKSASGKSQLISSKRVSRCSFRAYRIDSPSAAQANATTSLAGTGILSFCGFPPAVGMIVAHP